MVIPRSPSDLSREELDKLHADTCVDDSVLRAAVSRVPPSWAMIHHDPGSATFWFKRGNLQVAFTAQRYGKPDVWLHVSVCGRRGHSFGPGDPMHPSSYYLPSFEELKRVKHDFIGPDRWAYQVFPSEAQYVNQNPYVLHLYGLMDGQPALPDFTMGLGTI